ncbi:hypothetical protein EON64_14420 [archaeon]|nr:MAG: hypothetical protein EON64_14420 [archaeon]
MTMACADFFAAALRLYMWAHGLLDALQQDMAIKNIIFLVTFSGALSMYGNTVTRDWNSRMLLSWPISLHYPSRETQLVWLRYLFISSFLTISTLLTYMLVQVSGHISWVANIVMDVVLCLYFYAYTQNIHKKAVRNLFMACMYMVRAV